ncbi:MAG TPA: kelch repeat-containing protein, partial [Anaeromyxobacter sp.]|nr:kelch repeat-containing protein [Anaeromyxobacter sp.]
MRASVLGFTSLLVLLGMGGCSSGSHHSQAPARISGRTLALGTGAARTGHAAALLGDGTVLLAGGMVGGSATRTAEVFDPATGAVTPVAAQMQDARVNATATVLTDGRVLLAGGDNGSGTPLATAEVYDPATGAFSTAGAMTSARTLHTATRLPGGHVLIVGGRADASTVLASVEEFDPAASPASAWTFEPSGLALLRARARHTATLLGDGTILVAGGEDGGGTPLAQAYAAERVDPQSGSAYTTGLMTARARHTATLLRSGDVLVAGGFDGASDLSSVELYRPGTDDFAAAPGLSYARHDHTATLTPEGRVVLTGGTSGAATTAHVEIYDPVAGTTGAAGVISPPRSGHVATLLPSGRVLLSGGGSGQAEVLDRLNDLWTSPSVANYVPRYGHTATVLPKGPDAGKVLIVGGIDPYIGYLDSAQIYDPVHNTLTPTSGAQALPSMGGARAFHTATVLPNGDVLVAGGKSGGTNSLATAKLYRAATRSWAAAAGTMSAPRANHTATLLSTGKVLLAGGDDGTAPL